MQNPVFETTLDAEEVRKHVLGTYFFLRIGIAAAGLALPVILWTAGKAWAGLCLQDSMSAYYHAVGGDGRSLRDWFVGILFVVGFFLVLYRGFSPLENWLLNIGGALCVGVAIFPMRWDACQMFRNCDGTLGTAGCVAQAAAHAEWFNRHYFCAVTFFICLGLVCFLCSEHTLSIVPEPKKTRFRIAYYACGGLMIVLPLSAWIAYKIDPAGNTSYVFWAEFFAVVFFSLYWALKSFEIKDSASDKKAIEGNLKIERSQAVVVGPAQ